MSDGPPDIERLERTVHAIAGRRLVVLGDCMIDRYLWGRVDRISPDEFDMLLRVAGAKQTKPGHLALPVKRNQDVVRPGVSDEVVSER